MSDHAARISRIETMWTHLDEAHKGEDREALRTRRDLLLRYHGAAYRYLLRVVRQEEIADELTQDFAVRFLRGDYRGAAQERGRFRDYLKTALRNLARTYWERQKREQDRGMIPLSADLPLGVEDDAGANDPDFRCAWTEGLLERVWDALAKADEANGTAYAAALRLKTDQPQMRSVQLAELLQQALGKMLTADAVRQMIKRARERFADLLLDEVRASLPDDNLDAVEQELIDLELLPYCQSALHRRRRDR